MKSLALALCAVFLVACGQTQSAAQEQSKSSSSIQSVDELAVQIREDAATAPKVPLSAEEQQTNDYSTQLQQIDNTGTNLDTDPISCIGVFEQGGAVKCKTYPNARVEISGVNVRADQDGYVLIGFDRDAPASEIIVARYEEEVAFEKKVTIAPREYSISRIDGLPPSQVSTFTDEQLKRIRASSARKKTGFASREQTMWFKDGFTYPLKSFTKTSPFGAQRILNGEPKKPHYGVDIAAPVGTPIYAPADGTVSLADDDLYFEGAMVLLDHGQGLISMYLHMSAIDVEPGQVVKRGEKLGEVGSRGRSTGPHLCWRLKWRNRHLDPELLTEWPSKEHKHD